MTLGTPRGLEAGDIRSTSMGASGVDVLLSPAAKKLFGELAIECKNCESLNVTKIFHDHAAKYEGSTSLLVHKRNKTKPLVTITMEDYLTLLERAISGKP